MGNIVFIHYCANMQLLFMYLLLLFNVQLLYNFNDSNSLSQHLKYKTKMGIKCVVEAKIIEPTTYANTRALLFHAGIHILPFCILYFFLCLLTGVEVN